MCGGTEDNLLSCSHKLQHNCEHSEDVAVVCDGEVIFNPCMYMSVIFLYIVPCIEDSVRLVNLKESNPSQLPAYDLIKDTVARGVVEVCQNLSFVSVCEESWTNREASVICNMLGFSSHGMQAGLTL